MTTTEIAKMVEDLEWLGLDEETIAALVVPQPLPSRPPMQPMNQSLQRDLETLAMLRGETVPEVVERIKAEMSAQGADMEICREFFAELDEVARLHVN